MLQLRRWLAILGLVTFAVIWAAALRFQTGWMIPCAVLFAAGDALAALALMRGWFWARWFGLGIGLVGTMNIAVWLLMDGPSMREPYMVLQGIAFPSLFLLLLGPAMAERYDRKRSPANRWRYDHWPVRLLSWAVVLNIATAPMLLLHGCVDPSTPLSVRTAAIATAILTASGVVLVILQRSAGLLVMCVAGIGTSLLGLAALPGLLLPCGGNQFQMVLNTTAVAAFPGGVLGTLASMLAFAAPILRFLRARG